jgi:predicted dehydrogenase
MVSRMETGKPIEGLTALEINLKVIRIIELAKQSIATGRQVSLEPEHITRP